MEHERTCFFIGHRDTDTAVADLLAQAVERHITEYGISDFVVGHYGNFDRMAADALLLAKKLHPEVSLTLLLPYHPAVRSVPLPEGFDGSFYPPGMERVPRRLAIVCANRYMREHCTHLIAYVRYPASSARAFLEAALVRQRQGLMRVTNLSGWWPA